jgi:hypothetical protein
VHDRIRGGRKRFDRCALVVREHSPAISPWLNSVNVIHFALAMQCPCAGCDRTYLRVGGTRISRQRCAACAPLERRECTAAVAASHPQARE